MTAPLHTHQSAADGMLRVRVPGQHNRVTTFELFFDLIFVFAVTQISHGLATNLDVQGGLQALLLLLAMWWLWIYTTWATNWLDPGHFGVRLMLVGVMLAGLIVSAAIPEAFDSRERGLVLAISLSAAHLVRTAVVIAAMRHDPVLKLNFQRIFIWFVASGLFWVAGGFVEGGMRLALWVSALGVDYLGPPTAFWVPGLGRSAVSDWTVEGSHMAERCGLFMIIALGESLLITGATFSDLGWTSGTIGAMVAAFGMAVAMWWIYFDRTAEFANELIAHSEDPGRVARLAYTYIHLPLIAGIIVAAVGDEVVLAHPTQDAELRAGLTVVGGPAIFLAGYVLFKRAITGQFFMSHWVALVLLATLFAAHPVLSPVLLSGGVTVVLLGMAAWARFLHPAPLPELQPGELAARVSGTLATATEES